jgi:hypothetical protein
MDIIGLTTFLSPFLPFLIKFGEKSAETVGSKVGEDGWNKAKKIWDKLHPKIEAREDAKSAVKLVSTDTDDEDYRKVFQKQLKKLLDEDKELAAVIAQIMQDEESPTSIGFQIKQTANNNQGQVYGQITGGKVVGGNNQGGVNL